jgi:dihydroorotate dehydrogenase electron transfer subunit
MLTTFLTQATGGFMSRFCGSVPVLFNRRLGPSYYEMGLGGNAVAQKARPGQFVMIRIPGASSPLLRRPFSIHRKWTRKNQSGFSLLYKVVGECTTNLSEMKEGQNLEVLGPLGNHFALLPKMKSLWLTAGGVGVAPLVFWADELREKGVDLSGSRVYLGGASKEDLLCADLFLAAGLDLVLATENGTRGIHGLVTKPMEKDLAEKAPDAIFACGPPGMLRAVAKLAQNAGTPCQVSIETLMACGMGACLGCAVESKNKTGYRHACKDGPVFEADSIVL